MKNVNPISPDSPGSPENSEKGCSVEKPNHIQSLFRSWVLSTRPQTLIASISPVMIGSMIAWLYHPLSYWVLVLTFLFSLCLQIGTNWVNDYFDFIKGADTLARKGPHRAILSGQISPIAMRNAAFAIFFLAVCISIPLLARIGIAYTPLMLLCIFCAIFYTGGKYALGYLGLGDLLVLIFYGPIATCGTVIAQLSYIPFDAWIVSLIPGSLSCAILSINNLRDITEDCKAQKKTLVVRFGPTFGRIEYCLCISTGIIIPIILVLRGWPSMICFSWLGLMMAKEPLKIIFRHCENFNRALAITTKMIAIYTIMFCAAIYGIHANL